MNGLNIGIIICGYRFSDMMYSEIYSICLKEFQMLLIASAAGIMEKNVDNLMSLSMPLKVHELFTQTEMMDYTITRRRKSSGKSKFGTFKGGSGDAKQCKVCTDGTEMDSQRRKHTGISEAKHG